MKLRKQHLKPCDCKDCAAFQHNAIGIIITSALVLALMFLIGLALYEAIMQID